MKRDFSDEALSELIGYVKSSNNDAWYDSIGDLWNDGLEWVGILDINNYLEDIDNYHKKIIDKNDMTVEEIKKIFSDVNGVDCEFNEKFDTLLCGIKEQTKFIESLKLIMNPKENNFSLEGINKFISKQFLVDISEEMVKAYEDRLRRGTNGNDYDYDYINEIMRKKPEDLSPELYQALINIFHEMDDKEKEKFIEESYINGNKCYESSKYEAYVREWNISNVFVTMSVIDRENNKDKLKDNKLDDRYLRDYNIMNQIATKGKKIYIFNSNYMKEINVDITLKQVEEEKNSYCQININGCFDYSKQQGIMVDNSRGIKIYEHTNSGNESKIILNKIVSDNVESFRLDEEEEIYKLGISTFKDIASIYFDGGKVFDWTQTVIEGGNDYSELMDNVNESNKKVDTINSAISDGDTLRAFCATCTVTQYSDGSYSIDNIYVDKERLNSLLLQFQKDTGVEVDATAEDIENMLNYSDEDINSIEWIEKYKDWIEERE